MKKAFTLIELLVVIAIIAILAAILFPVFAQAKLAAKKTAALSNVKQLTLGIIMYNNDVDDEYDVGCGSLWYYPGFQTQCGGGAGAGGGGWSWDISPYVKNAGIFQDASNTPANGSWPTWFAGNDSVIKVSYASNGLMHWEPGDAKYDVIGLMGMDQGSTAPACYSTAPWMGIDRRNASQNGLPAETILLAARWGGNDIFGQGDMLSGVNWWDNVGAGLIPNGSLAAGQAYYAPYGGLVSGQYLVNADIRNGALATTYNNSTPITFADGHAKAMNQIATDPDPVNQPQKNLWDSTR